MNNHPLAHIPGDWLELILAAIGRQVASTVYHRSDVLLKV